MQGADSSGDEPLHAPLQELNARLWVLRTALREASAATRAPPQVLRERPLQLCSKDGFALPVRSRVWSLTARMRSSRECMNYLQVVPDFWRPCRSRPDWRSQPCAGCSTFRFEKRDRGFALGRHRQATPPFATTRKTGDDPCDQAILVGLGVDAAAVVRDHARHSIHVITSAGSARAGRPRNVAAASAGRSASRRDCGPVERERLGVSADRVPCKTRGRPPTPAWIGPRRQPVRKTRVYCAANLR
jgi:hypothetical protein